MTKIKKIHMMGVLGSGMSGVYSLASKMGYEVSGCDLKSSGHNKSHLDGIDLLVVSPAVLYQKKEDPELTEARKLGMVVTWEEFLGKTLAKDKKVIAIAGTHGKSTTTAMVAKVLIDNGFDPSVVIGAYVPEWGGNSRFGKGEYLVIEADEFNDNFLNYHPDILVINNIEFDHPDYFKDEKQLNESFNKLISKMVGQKKLFVEKDSLDKKFNLKVIGGHNQKNANMAFLVGKSLNISEGKIIESLESFVGIGRRMEEIGENVFDDYAHHPTAIKTTLAGLREKNIDKKIWAVVEPHGFKRTKALLNLYKDAFKSADKVIIGPIFKARDEIDSTITPELISKVSNHKNIIAFNSFNEILEFIKNEFKKGDVLIVMGAGESNKWAKEIKKTVNGYSFKDLTTLKIGGKIKHFFEVKNKEELVEKVKFGKENNLPIFTIGGGTDIAVSDKDFDGVVIKYVGDSFRFENKDDNNYVTAEAGVVWDKLVKLSVDKNLQGIECLSGIPGTVGAAPIQNIGAYGQELSETFVNLNAYDIQNEKFATFNNKDCDFSYRESFFKKKENWQKFVITDVTFMLSEYLDKDLELQTIRDEVLRVREEKLVSPDEVPNAGSFFKNPIVDKNKKEELESKFEDLKSFSYGDKFKLSAGWLIEKSGWKGRGIGPVSVSNKHALVITNPEGKGNFNDIKNLADRIIEDVDKMFGVKLEPEVQYINT